MANADRIIDLLHEAKSRPPGAERERFLTDACGNDAALKAQVVSLLEAEAGEGDSDFLKQSPLLRPAVPLTEKPGDRIGRYKLLQQIGEGGCGVVYMAEQEEPVRRRVALKVIKLGMDTKQVIARFEAERQALALMDHPNIAKVLDAGATETGRPFFVMELVRGVKITEFCDQKQLSPRERLELFVAVCRAVQHAHQKGIIHRDLKPSNILVTIVDGRPVPKVIDFGIAKATNNQRLTDQTLFTAFEQFIGTPAYMSPEQAELSGVDIDTRTDIYSLGVVLYELLTGKTPFDPEELLRASIDEIRRTIRDQQPPKPSTRLHELPQADVTTTAQARQTDAPRLIQQMRGDLDWIVMKCLEKERDRRYETANGLAMDIERHLKCEPVTARPPSRLYEFQKTVRRHRVGFAAAAAVMVALVLGLAVATWRFAKERQAYQRAVAAEEDARKKQAEAESAHAKLQKSEREKRQNLYVAEMHLARTAWEEGQLEKAMELLRSHLPETGEEDLRGFEWRYLWKLCQGDALVTLTGHKDYVQCLALSPDARLLATGSGDGAIKLWDVVTRQEIMTLPSSANSVRSLAFSPDGKTLAAAYSSTSLELWDVKTHRVLAVLGQVPREDKKVLFLRNGRLLACATVDGAVTLWDVETKTLMGRLQGGETSRPAIAISPDGAMIAAASGHSDILLWDVASRTQLAILSGHTANVVSLQFAPDGLTLASSSADTTIRLWEVATRREVALLRGHKVWVSSVAFSPNGRRLASTSVDGLIKLWDVALRTELGTLRGHNAWVNQATFSLDDSMMVSVSDDRTIRIWDTSFRTGRTELKGHAAPVMDFQFLPDGKRLAILSPDGDLSIWDVVSGRQTDQLSGSFKGISESGRIILGVRAGGEIELWDSVNRQVITTIRELTGSPSMAVFSPDDRYLACADREGNLRVWEVRTGILQGTLSKTTQFVENLWFPGGAKTLVLGFQRFPEPSPTGLLFTLRTFDSLTEASTINPSEGFRFWDIQAGQEMETLPKNVQRIRQTFEDGFSLSLVRDGLGGARVESGAKPRNYSTRLSSFLPVVGGKLIIIGGERDITLWEVETGRRVATLEGHGGWVTTLALSPDGSTLASAANDGALKLWNLALRKEVITLPGQISPHTRKLAFAPDGNAIAALSLRQDRRVRLFHAPSLQEIDEAESAKKASTDSPP